MFIRRSTIFVPLEIVREILEATYLSEAPPDISTLRDLKNVGISTKPAWSVLAPVSCTNHVYRDIVLEVWFHTLRVQRPEELEVGRQMFPRMSQWVRFLHCHLVPPVFFNQFDLVGMQKLNTVRIDHATLCRVPMSDEKGPFQLFHNLPLGLVEVQINAAKTYIYAANPSLFMGIQNFVNLTILRVRTMRAWCDLCYLDQDVGPERAFPDLLVYEGGNSGLPLLYREMLSSLEHLQIVSFATSALRLTGDPPEPAALRAGNEDLASLAWSGECDWCIHNVLSDEDFRSRWVAVKTGQIEETQGSGGRKYHFYPIPSLQRVEWHFVPEEIDEETDDEEDGWDYRSARDSEEDSGTPAEG